MSEPRIVWAASLSGWHKGYLPGKDQLGYDIILRCDGAFELYGMTKTDVTSLGLFLDLESAKAHVEQLEAEK